MTLGWPVPYSFVVAMRTILRSPSVRGAAPSEIAPHQR
ncbi:MAG: hypothetical protein ACI8PQ_001769, partial [Planctomycetota bacterium]